jgi:hypothetical protein
MRWGRRKRFKATQFPDEIHAFIPGDKPIDLDALTKSYQENIRKSPIFKMMVKKFGRKKAEELLKEFKVELKK